MDQENPEVKVKIAKLVDYIRQGWSRRRILEVAQNEFGYSYQQAIKYVHDAYVVLSEDADEVIEQAKGIQIERIETLLKNALDCKDNKTATKALDMLNKIYSLYIDKKEVDVNVEDLRFTFGDEELDEN